MPWPRLHQIQTATDLLDWIVSFDARKVRDRVASMRHRWPDATPYELAERAFASARFRVIAAGAALGIAANPALTVASTLADVSMTTRTQVFAAACAAELLIPGFLDTETARYELLLPIFGTSVLSQIGIELGLKATRFATREMVLKVLSSHTATTIGKMLSYTFGLRLTQRGLATKTMPVVGGILGGTWNAVEVEIVRIRTLRYLTNQAMDLGDAIDIDVVTVTA